LHADDFGMSHSVNRAIIEMFEAGAISSASIMMPCPWVPEAAAWARAHLDKDVGLHLTLNSEWTTLRWGPLAPRDRVPGLLDAEGYLHAAVAQTATRATAQEVELELRAQIEQARRLGIRFTHLDTHMGTLYARPDYFQVFEKLGREYGVPILRVKASEAAAAQVPPAMRQYLLESEARYQAEGVFRLDSLLTDPARGTSTYEQRRDAYHKTLQSLKPGVHMIILHPGYFDEELKGATGSAQQRDWDRRIFLEPETRQLVGKLGIRLVGWQDVARPAR
ncbi:MAG: polysaccharide deacetylase family protein, partial [Bryobacteraceae bacterium]